MRTATKVSLLFFIYLIVYGSLSAQTAVINNIDPSAYPWITATYTIKDASNAEVRVSNATDVIIKEDGTIKPHKPNVSPYCPPPDQKTFSVCLVIDASASMFGAGIDGSPNSTPVKIQVVLDALRGFIDVLDTSRTEVSIVEFGTTARIVNNWSNNRDSLHKALDINNIFGMQYTDYNSAFLGFMNSKNNVPFVDSSQSALHMVLSAKYKRVIVFLTDGKFDATSDCIGKDPFNGTPIFLMGDVITQARRQLTRVFVIHIGTEALDSKSTSYLQGLAGIEGSSSDNLRTGITSASELGNYYKFIADICGQVGYPAPCQVTWQSQCAHFGANRNLELDFPNNWNLSATKDFSIPTNIMPALDIKARNISFLDVNPGTTRDTNVVIKATQNFADITGFSSTAPTEFFVKSWGTKTIPFTLNQNESATVTLSYAPTDSCFSGATVSILGSSCSGNDITVDGTMSMFIPEVDMGNETVGVPKTLPISDFFRNRTNSNFTITKIGISTGDAGDFSTPTPTPNIQLTPCQSTPITFGFKPLSNGPKSSLITLETDAGKKFTAKIIGNGMGLPGITSVNPLVFQNTDCSVPARNDTIWIKNTGPVKLDSINGSIVNCPGNDFILNTILPTFILPLDSIPVSITFAPNSAGPKLCTLLVNSNATNSKQYNIELRGTADSVDYMPAMPTYDLGTVCLGSTDNINFNLNNVGTKNLTVNVGSKPATYAINNPTWAIPGGGNANVQVAYTPTKEGPINDSIVFVETLCNLPRIIHFTGTVYDPRIANIVETVQSNVGVGTDDTFTITNPSVNDLIMTGIAPQASPSQFQFINTIPPLPYTIPAGGTMQIHIIYTPTVNTLAIDSLVMTGMPCHDVKVPLQGNPSLAQVDIVIDKTYTGLIGATIPFELKLQSGTKFPESTTSTINTEISFDATMLAQDTAKYQETTIAGITTLKLDTIPVKPINSLQIIRTLYLKVLPVANTSTDLLIKNTVSDKNNVVFNPSDGKFTIVSASATLQTKDYSAKPGDEVDINIYQTGGQGLNAFHQGITSELRFNATLLDPAGDTKKGTVVNGERIVPLDGIPINTSSSEVILKTFKFKAMLGDSESTPLILQNSNVLSGKVDFSTIVGKFTLQICKSGGDRLFNPNTNPAMLAIKPNPADANAEVEFNLTEEGITKIWISDLLGNQVKLLLNEEKQIGLYNLGTDTRDLPAGVYFVIMQTPTQVLKKTLNILK